MQEQRIEGVLSNEEKAVLEEMRQQLDSMVADAVDDGDGSSKLPQYALTFDKGSLVFYTKEHLLRVPRWELPILLMAINGSWLGVYPSKTTSLDKV